MKRNARFIGLAILPQALQMAEVIVDGSGARRVTATAELPFTNELSLQDPTVLGKSLAQVLKDRGFSGRDTVIGLPARWIVSRPRQLPPATPDTAAASLRLQAESEFASEMKDLAIDYIGTPNRSKATSVLLVGTARSHVDSCVALARAAGLRIHAITITSTALISTVKSVNGALPLLLNIERGGAELVLQSDGPLVLRHLNISEAQDNAGSLASDVRRTLAGVPSAKVGEVLLADPAQLLSGGATVLQDRLHLPVRPHQIELPGGKDASARFTPAVALALAGFAPASADFLHSRLAPPAKQRPIRKIAWLSGIAAALLLVMGLAYWDLSSTQTSLSDKQARLDAIAEDVKVAQLAEERLKFARSWAPRRERYVACLADLTRLFPDEATIWASSLHIRADLGGQFSGKATSEGAVLSLLDKLQDSSQFVDAKLLDMRDGGAGREIAYSISFTYRPRE